MAEISALEDKFEAWILENEKEEKAKPARAKVTKTPRVSSMQNRAAKIEEDGACAMIKNELSKIECDIIANGGINCGWEASDHEDFLKVRTKMGPKLTVGFITAMRRAVPTADEIAVRAHFDAYATYQKLVEDKKDLIAKYKEAKDQEK